MVPAGAWKGAMNGAEGGYLSDLEPRFRSHLRVEHGS